jgi:alpha-glucoside transport system permease protein
MSTFLKYFRKWNVISTATLLVVVLVWLTPTIGLLVTAFRPREASVESGWWTVFADLFNQPWTTEAFATVLEANNLGQSFIATAAVAIPATVLPITFAAFAAYGFTFLEFKGREFWFSVIIGLMVVPMQAAIVAVLKMFVAVDEWLQAQPWNADLQFHITGEYPAGWIVHSAFAMPLAVYILRNYMMTLPNALVEAARIDGASHFQIFWRLIVPMSVPALASFAIFQFLWVWNDYFVAFIFVGNHEVLTYTLLGMLGQQQQGWQIVMAGCLISVIVPLTVFFSLQRYFVKGLTAGSVK